MDIFRLPDLGEGLPDAEIHEWFVKEGDSVALDQPLVSMETAKAVVDVPSPQAGVVAKLYGKPGDVIKTGEALIAFATEEKRADQGTVVGHLEESHDAGADDFIIGSRHSSKQSVKTTPAVRMLAKKHGIQLNTLNGSGDHGVITQQDVQREIERLSSPEPGFEPLRGVRRAMLNSMVQSHKDVVPVSLFDDADIHHWHEKTDITVALIRAINAACTIEPALNAWFDTTHAARKCFEVINLGLAMDNEEGLFVPVIHDTTNKSDTELRALINNYKTSVSQRNIAPENLKGATITLSNFGKFSGRYASPIIVPPMVAIIAVGRLYQGAVVAKDGSIAAHRLLPLSLSFDHRAVTGGEATRFLGAVIQALEAQS